MHRRTFLAGSAAALWRGRLAAAFAVKDFAAAARILQQATQSGQVAAASLFVSQSGRSTEQAFGTIASPEAMFLLGSISKPIAVTALMTLFDAGEFRLDDPVRKFVPDFQGAGREQITLRHLLTHSAGLPDQLPENDRLRAEHAPLSEFVQRVVSTPLLFTPGSRYSYASMGILLASFVAERICGIEIKQFITQAVLAPLEMRRSAQGLGRFAVGDFVPCQTERAAPESGAGDPDARSWDWNSPYWRGLGAPWGGTHCSAADVGRFMEEFLKERGRVVKPSTARLMVTNASSAGLTPRGLGFKVGVAAGVTGCSERTFGHTGSTGTIAWADPASETICVVLTSLPGQAAQPHPRDVAAELVAAAVQAD